MQIDVTDLVRELWPLHQIYTNAKSDLRLVGGCVRDTIMGRTCEDIDLATPMLAADGMSLLQQHGYSCESTGLEHGVFTVSINNRQYEIATLRIDVETDGRRARCEFTTDWSLDAARRDLTINALYADFEGKVTDYVGGLDDLQKGLIQFCGEPRQRISEDYLRILRFYRFMGLFELEPNADTEAALIQAAPMLTTLSIERRHQELVKILASPNPCRAMGLMDKHRALEYVVGSYDIDRFKRYVEAEAAVGLTRSWCVRLLALTASADAALERSTKRQMQSIQKLYLDPLFERPTYFYHASLVQVDTVIDAVLVKYASTSDGCSIEYLGEIIRELRDLQVPVFPIKGTDLIKLPIPRSSYGCILDRCRRFWAADCYRPDHDACLEYIMSTLSQP